MALEIDVSDQESYIKKLIREVLNQQDVKLMGQYQNFQLQLLLYYYLFLLFAKEIFDATWSADGQGFGAKEFNLLLIIRLQDMHSDLSEAVNAKFVQSRS